jgi:hypothetical protein
MATPLWSQASQPAERNPTQTQKPSKQHQHFVQA